MYDPLWVASPVTLVGKMVFREACDRHLPWDAQESGMHQGLLAAKARLAKKGLTMPRLELISAHMAANLVDNVRGALEGCVVWSVYGWTDSTVILHWIAGQGSYNQFASSRVAQINAKAYVKWSYVGTKSS